MPFVDRSGRRAILAGGLLTAIAAASGIVMPARGQPVSEDPERAVAARMMQELMSGTRAIGGPFSLPDAAGRVRPLSEFRGRLVLLYFGYTYCPDVCPTDLVAIGNAMERLGARAKEVQPLFITLDPQRDDGAMLSRYVSSFHPGFVALRGSEAEVRRIATDFRVFYRKITPPGAATYMIDHTAFTYLLDRDGRYIAFFPPATSGERIASFVRDHL